MSVRSRFYRSTKRSQYVRYVRDSRDPSRNGNRCRARLTFFFAHDHLLIFITVHQVFKVSWIADPDLDQPAVAVGVLVDDFRTLRQVFIHLDDGATDRRVNIGNSLNRFHHSEWIVLADLLSDRRQLDIYDLPELLLRMIGYADGCD